MKKQEGCKWVKKITPYYAGFGVTKQQCCKSIYKDGFCNKHYKRYRAKILKWGERPSYKEAIPEDLASGRSLKIKDTSHNLIFNQRNGSIYLFQSKTNSWVKTEYPLDHTLFCVKIL